MSSFRRPSCYFAACVLALLPATAAAQARGDTWVFRASGFFPKIDTQARLDGSGGRVGTTIDFETDVGLDDSKTLPLLDMTWRFLPNHRVQLSYLDLSRSATSTLRTQINWGDQTYQVNSTVSGEFDSQVTALTYLYSFYRTPETELSAGIGLFYTDITAGLSTVGGTISASRSVSAKAPLPVLAFNASQRFTETIGGELRYQWFGIKIQEYDGSLNVFNAVLTWFPWKNIGFEGGYNYTRYDLGVDRENWRGEAKYTFKGPTLGIVASF
jgi:hypothetical protein